MLQAGNMVNPNKWVSNGVTAGIRCRQYFGLANNARGFLKSFHLNNYQLGPQSEVVLSPYN